MNFFLATFLGHPCRLVFSGAASTLMYMEVGTFWVMVNISWYHSFIFPYVGFSIGQVLLVLSYLSGSQFIFDAMYWFFDVWRLLHWKSECLAFWEGDLDYLRLYTGCSDQKIWGVNFFFNCLLAGLTNHPYMAFPNLGPPLVLGKHAAADSRSEELYNAVTTAFLDRISNPLAE